MEYEEEENSVPGNIPEFGAVFMSNAETKRECFRRRVFALPSSMAGFVKQVKAGMVLFLFEFEKRQLFGVYKATSDGALNILPNAFRSGGKQFPAQVCFTPIWLCSPLSENEFQSAIRENYYSARKFKFGLSEDQVRRLLQLFSTRKLKDRLPAPSRQLTRRVSRFSSKGRKRIDHGRYAMREGLEMERSNEDFTPTVMNEYLENIEDRGTEVDDERFYIEDRIEDDENLGSFGRAFLTDNAGDSLHKKRRISYEALETDETHASSLSFGMDNREVPMHRERIPAASGRFLGGEDRDDGWNIFNSLSPAFATKCLERPFNLTKTADEGLYSDGTNRLAAVDGRFLTNDIMTTELGLHDARRYVISNEHETGLFERAGKIADDCEFLRNSQVGHNHHIDDGIAPVVPSESFETSLHRVRGTAAHRRFLTNERVISEHDPYSGQRMRLSSGKVADPLYSHERKFDEQRFSRNNLVKANYMEGHDGSATLNMSSGYDARIERQIADDFGLSKSSSVVSGHHVGSLPGPVMSTKTSAFHQPHQSSLECFTKPFPDSQFPGFTTQSQNFKPSNSIFHDSVVTRSVPCLSETPSVHNARSVSFGAHQGASVAKESIPPHYGENFFGLSKGKSFEAEGSNTYNASGFGNKVSFPNYHDYSGCRTDEICDGMDLKSPSSADYKNYQFSPSNLGPVASSESRYFNTRNNPFEFDGHPYGVSQGMQKHIPRRINDVRKYIPRQANDEIHANSSEFDMCYPEKDSLNRHLDFSRGYGTDVIYDDIQYYRSPEGPSSDRERHRMSVFARLTSTTRLYAQEEEDADIYDASSVDEIMEMLHQNDNVRIKNLKKFNSLVRQHDEEEEMEKNNKGISFENQMEHGHSKIISLKLNKEISPAIEQGVDDKPKETRMVEFKRRREMKKSLDDKTLENNAIGKEDSVSEENKELESPLDKQGKRRKLVRPVFGQNNC